ncbi:hypothetical protein PIB30_049645 [Stylosanthes scabra]|uniref:Uncharacterized protein n=1 Tax=Stylosanthes scabra TaxID=79078 RepID=A0ABU6RHZ7_9FABA|nr:hypothetical protein [Stylosanthes scabra]
MSNQLMEEAYLYAQGYTPWNPPPYPPSETDIEETFQLLCQERKELRENQRRVNAQLTTLTLSIIRLVTKFTNEEVEEENVDQEVEDKDKEPKGMEIVYPQHYGLLETDGQLRVLCGVLDKKEMDSLGLDKSRFITWEKLEFKAYSEHLHKLHNNKVKVGALNLRKHLGPWQFQEELVDLQNDGWTNQVWDLGKIYKNQHFWGLVTYLGILASLMYMIWNPIKNTKSKYWWRFIASVRVLRILVYETWDIGDQCNDKNWWKFQEEFKHKPP